MNDERRNEKVPDNTEWSQKRGRSLIAVSTVPGHRVLVFMLSLMQR